MSGLQKGDEETPARCPACGHAILEPVLDFGPQPLSDAFLTDAQRRLGERRAPLALLRCAGCALWMLERPLPPRELFGAGYLYCSSVSRSLQTHFGELAGCLASAAGLRPGDLAIEVASNDGVLLSALRDQGLRVLGIEPAPHPAAAARARGLPIVERFLDRRLAAELRDEGHRPRLVVAANVLAHNADLRALADALTLLADDGLLVVEVPYLGDLLERLAFDTIYHEHAFYFSAHALERLFSCRGFSIVELQRVAAQGGSLRLFLRRGAAPGRTLGTLLAEEAAGSLSAARVAGFASAIETLATDGRRLLRSLKRSGHSIAAYGAAAKGTVLLNRLALGPETLDYVVDRNPLKQGRWVPGAGLPIVGPERLWEAPPDYLLILPWNLAAEIREQEAEWERRGGRFIVPLPRFEIL